MAALSLKENNILIVYNTIPKDSYISIKFLIPLKLLLTWLVRNKFKLDQQ